MPQPIRLLATLLVCAGLASCVAYPYPAEPQTIMVPASFDRSWDAALGAASDSGIQVTSADRASGRITGTKAGAAVTITARDRPSASTIESR